MLSDAIGRQRVEVEMTAGVKRNWDPYPARRWVMERTLGWLSTYHALLIRYVKKASNFLGLDQMTTGFSGHSRSGGRRRGHRRV